MNKQILEYTKQDTGKIFIKTAKEAQPPSRKIEKLPPPPSSSIKASKKRSKQRTETTFHTSDAAPIDRARHITQSREYSEGDLKVVDFNVLIRERSPFYRADYAVKPRKIMFSAALWIRPLISLEGFWYGLIKR